MQTVGYFIRFCTNHAGVYVVDRFYKRIKWNRFKFRKQLGHFFINGCPKVRVPAEDIFVKAGLAFVKSHHIDLGCGSVPEILIDILLKDCMTALVNGGEHRRNRIVGIIVVCYADIAGAKRRRKGMHTLGNRAAVKGKADIRKQQLLYHLSLEKDLWQRLLKLLRRKYSQLQRQRNQKPPWLPPRLFRNVPFL